MCPETHSYRLGVIGNPISHSASPAMHNAMLRDLSLPGDYKALLVEDEPAFRALMTEAKQGDFHGFNVTIPHKELAFREMEDLDDSASLVGAVNTIVVENGRLKGYNTDGAGFLWGLKEETGADVTDKSIIILGAGGAARGIVGALIEKECGVITVVNRNVSKAKALVSDFQDRFSEMTALGYEDGLLEEALANADIIIQTTSVGMGTLEGQSPLRSYDWVTPQHICCEIIYKPKETAFAKACAEKGATLFYGAGMLAGQGALAFELFTGKKANYKIMKQEV